MTKDLRRGRPDGHPRINAKCPMCGKVRNLEKRDAIKNPLCVTCSGKRRKKHGASIQGHKNYGLYQIWMGMRDRCHNPNCGAFKHYGGRGIGICEEWDDFETFRRDMGERPKGMTLDRKNNNRNYCKENCRWATSKQQMNNTRRTVHVTVNGKRMALTRAVAKFSYLSHAQVYSRLKYLGWDIISALKTPIGSVNNGQEIMKKRNQERHKAATVAVMEGF